MLPEDPREEEEEGSGERELPRHNIERRPFIFENLDDAYMENMMQAMEALGAELRDEEEEAVPEAAAPVENLPIHPDHLFMARQDMTQEVLDRIRMRLEGHRFQLINQVALFNNQITYVPRFGEQLSPTMERLLQECFDHNEELARYMDEMRPEQRNLRLLIIFMERQEAALVEGMNFMRENPDVEFVIYITEEQNVLQRVQPLGNIFPTPPPTSIYHRKYPRNARLSHFHHQLHLQTNAVQFDYPFLNRTNQTNFTAECSHLRPFKIVSIQHSFEIFNLTDGENKIIIFPTKNDVLVKYQSMLDHNLKLFSDTIRGYFTTPYYLHHLVDLENVYSRFKNTLAVALEAIENKFDFINKVNDAVLKELSEDYHWYYDPLASINNVIDKMYIMNTKFFNIEPAHKFAHDELKK